MDVPSGFTIPAVEVVAIDGSVILIFPLPNKDVLLIVLIFVPETRVSCFPFNTFCKSVWFDNVPVILPHSALVCVLEIITFEPLPVIEIPVPAFAEVKFGWSPLKSIFSDNLSQALPSQA